VFNLEQKMKSPTVLIIGAGIGGIATAARLARHGYRVTVVEKCDGPGGRCGALVKDGHHFVNGPTLFLMPELYAQTFSDLGERMEDHLDLRRIDPTYHIHFRDGSTLVLTSDLLAMQDQLEAIEPGSFGRYLSYLDQGYGHYKLSLAGLVQRNFRNLAEFCTIKNLFLLFRIKALRKHYNNIGNYFDDPRLKATFTFQDMYVGLSPYEAPALFSLLQYSELANGVWFPMGGMSRVIESLVNISQKWGVRFLYNAPVKQIDVDGRRATGVTLADGQQLNADVVVANADLPYVYRHLLTDDGTADRLERKRYSCSAMMFYWGVDKRYSQLQPHHLFFAADIRRNYENVTENLTIADDPSFYLHAPGQLDPSMAPEGQDTLTVVVPVGHLTKTAPQDWPALQKRMRQVVLQRLVEFGLKDLEKHIKFEICYTPLDWQARFNLVKGASHGLSHNLTQMGYFRPHNRHARYRNLYFVGASTHPGTGLPIVLVSARLVTERLLQDAEAAQPASAPRPIVALSQ
jgi:phytoene desaturase